MTQIDGLRRYLEAGLALGQITRARAEEAVRELIQTGEVEGTKAQEWVEHLVVTSRERYEAFVTTVRREVSAQLSEVGVTNVDELAHRVARVLEKGQAAARKATRRPSPAKKARKKAPARKTTKKATARKTPAKKTAARKTTKKATARKTPAKKTAARKTAVKKTAARKTSARKTASGRSARR